MIISTRNLELMLWKARPDSSIYPQDCTILFTQLNNVNFEIKNEVLSPYVKFPLTQEGTWDSIISYVRKSFEANIGDRMLGCQALLSTTVVPNVYC